MTTSAPWNRARATRPRLPVEPHRQRRRRPVPTQRGHRETRMGDRAPSGRDRVAPTPDQLGDEARVGATLAVAHPESSTASSPSCEVACHALAASRTDPTRPSGNRHGRPQGSPLYHFHRLRAARRGAGRTAGSDRVAPRAPSTYLGLVPRRFRHGGCPVKSLRRERQYRDRQAPWHARSLGNNRRSPT